MSLSCAQMIELINAMPEIDAKDFCISLIEGTLNADVLPTYLSSVTTIGSYAFSFCNSLALTVLPESIQTIDGQAFYSCPSLALTVLPESIEVISTQAFAYCTGLKSITFKGTPNSIHYLAFQDCTNLTTINVPWSEGEVAGAPWGATNATINYNYTGE